MRRFHWWGADSKLSKLFSRIKLLKLLIKCIYLSNLTNGFSRLYLGELNEVLPPIPIYRVCHKCLIEAGPTLKGEVFLYACLSPLALMGFPDTAEQESSAVFGTPIKVNGETQMRDAHSQWHQTLMTYPVGMP